MSLHTPGPWVINSRSGNVIQSSNGYGVATARWRRSQKTMQANAKLIAAAPDLLAALEELVETLEEGVNIAIEPGSSFAQKCVRAVYKATGLGSEE